MTTVTFDPTLFRALFGEFADPATHPDALLQVRWDEAAGYMSADTSCTLSAKQLGYALQCMTAHLCRLAKTLAAASVGVGVTGVLLQATVDKVSVMLQAPPSRGEWGHWLAQTPYGQTLSAFLAANASGGFYVGGLPERAAFRKGYGVF